MEKEKGDSLVIARNEGKIYAPPLESGDRSGRAEPFPGLGSFRGSMKDSNCHCQISRGLKFTDICSDGMAETCARHTLSAAQTHETF